MHARPAVIVLAAGGGTRFHGSGHKLAQQLTDCTVLGATLQHVAASGLPVVVVTIERLAALALTHVAAHDVVVLPQVAKAGDDQLLGMGYSIAAGVSARAHAPGWLVLPGDMPMVRPQSIRAVADELAQHPIAYAQHRGRRGHPVGFAAELYSELVVLSGDVGASRLLARYPAAAVEIDDPGVLVDVDTEDDLQRVRDASAAISPLSSATAKSL